MSLGSQLVKGVIALVACGSVGVTLSNYSHNKRNYQSDVSLVKELKHQYAAEKKKKPSVERVITVYQQAMNTANKYLKLQNELHDLGDVSYAKQRPLIKKMKKYTTGNLAPAGSLVQPAVKDWHANVDYGGQTGNGRVVMAYRWFNKDNQLMRIDTFYYNTQNHKLSGFSYYITNEGAKETRDQVRGWDS